MRPMNPQVCVCVCPLTWPLLGTGNIKGTKYYLLHAMKLAFDLNLTMFVRRGGSDYRWQ